MYQVRIDIHKFKQAIVGNAVKAANGNFYVDVVIDPYAETNQYDKDASIFIKDKATKERKYIGNVAWKQFEDSQPIDRTMQIMLSLNVTQIAKAPANKIWTDQQGKCWVTLSVVERKEKDKYGNTINAYFMPTEEESKDGAPKEYVGNGRMKTKKETTPVATMSEDDLKDLF